MTRKRAKSADQTSLGTPGMTETPGALRKTASGLRGTPPSAIVRGVPEFIWEMSVRDWYRFLGQATMNDTFETGIRRKYPRRVERSLRWLAKLAARPAVLARQNMPELATVARDDAKAEWHFRLGRARGRMKDWAAAAAAAAYEAAVAQDDAKAEWHFRLGRARERLKDWAAAAAAYEAAVARDDAKAEWHFRLGRARERMIDWVAAAAAYKAAYKAAVARDDAKAEWHFRLGRARIPKNKIKSGYILKLDDAGSIVAPGWSVRPGDKIGLALNSATCERVSGSITFTDAAGRPAFILHGFEFGQQDFSNEEPWLNGAGFSISGSGQIPLDLPSGVYFAADDPTLFVVVKAPEQSKPTGSKKSKIVILISTNTFNAYSITQNRSLYAQPCPVPAVSFYRPQTRTKSAEWRPFLKWVVSEKPFGPDVETAYISDFEMDEPRWLADADLLVVLGHSEYWTRKARETFDAFVERGGNVLVASGNTMWWQVRYEGDDRSVLVSYKSNADQDPEAGTPLETTRWPAQVLNYPVVPSIGGSFPHGGYGIYRRPKNAKGWGGYMVIDGSHPLLDGTGLRDGDCFPFFALREYDGAPILGFDARGMPVPDLEQIGAHKFELLGFDLGYRDANTVGTMHVMQRTPTSGYLFNVGAKDFARTFAKGDREPWRRGTQIMKQIFKNFISRMLSNESPFSESLRQREVIYPMTTPWPNDLPANLPWLSNPPACQPKSDQKTTKQVSVKRPPPQDSDSEARKLKALEEENQKLKKLLSESMLDVSTLRKMLGKNF